MGFPAGRQGKQRCTFRFESGFDNRKLFLEIDSNPRQKEYHHRVSFKKGFFLPHFLSNRPLRAYLTGLVLRVDYIMYTEKTSSFDAMAIEKSRRTCSGEITNILTKYTLLHEENRTKTLKVKGWLFGRTHPPPLPPSSLLEREDRYWPT